MWKHVVQGIAGSVPFELSIPKPIHWPWRKILADAGLVAAFAITASWLMR
jgi:hypothetical protein